MQVNRANIQSVHCFKGHLLWKIHFYMVFEHKCVLAHTAKTTLE